MSTNCQEIADEVSKTQSMTMCKYCYWLRKIGTSKKKNRTKKTIEGMQFQNRTISTRNAIYCIFFLWWYCSAYPATEKKQCYKSVLLRCKTKNVSEFRHVRLLRGDAPLYILVCEESFVKSQRRLPCRNINLNQPHATFCFVHPFSKTLKVQVWSSLQAFFLVPQRSF